MSAGFDAGQLDRITAYSESGGNPDAVSPQGARGLMQVMPSTARDPGFGIRPSNGTQEDNVRLGKEYRAKMLDRYDGDPAMMWGAYNWGPGNMDRVRNDPNWLARAPRETRNYVNKNLKMLRDRR